MPFISVAYPEGNIVGSPDNLTYAYPMGMIFGPWHSGLEMSVALCRLSPRH